MGVHPLGLGGWEVDEIVWCMKWSAALTPELAMIPDRSVFLRASTGRSLTTTVEGTTDHIWESWDYVDDANDADDAKNGNNTDDVSNAGNVTDRSDVEVVEGICCCITHEPKLETRVSQDQVLFV